MAEPIGEYVITSHAIAEMRRRGIDEATLRRLMEAPEQRELIRPGRDVVQSRIEFASKIYLVRAFVDVDRKPAEVVCVHRHRIVAKRPSRRSLAPLPCRGL